MVAEMQTTNIITSSLTYPESLFLFCVNHTLVDKTWVFEHLRQHKSASGLLLVSVVVLKAPSNLQHDLLFSE